MEQEKGRREGKRTLSSIHQVCPAAIVAPPLLHLQDRGRVRPILPPERARGGSRKRMSSKPGLKRGRIEEAPHPPSSASGTGSARSCSGVVVVVRVLVEGLGRGLVAADRGGFGGTRSRRLGGGLVVFDVEVRVVGVFVVGAKVVELFVRLWTERREGNDQGEMRRRREREEEVSKGCGGI